MHITGTHFNYYMVCHRKLWLFANNIQMEQSSDLVYDGKMLHENSYKQRSSKYEEISIDGIKIDYYDTKNKVIHEIKRSSKLMQSHAWQVKYYIYVLELNGVEGATGLLEYPKERKTEEIFLSTPNRERIKELLLEIDTIIHSKKCPKEINQAKCKKCSYYDFCYTGEIEKD